VHTAIRRVGFIAVLGAVGCYAWVRLSGPQGLADMQAKRSEVEEYSVRNAHLQSEIDGLRKETEDLQTNREVMELWIRKITNKIKRNETKFIPPAPSN
jgi:cell division protein FtsB